MAATTAHTGTITNCMDERLLSRGSSALSTLSRGSSALSTFSRGNSDISTSPFIPTNLTHRFSTEPNGVQTAGESPAKLRYKIPAPIDQFFRGAELGKWLLTLDGGALVALMGFHLDSALLSKQFVGPMVVLLVLGFCALFTGLLFQESCPELAVVTILIGAACVVATFLTLVAAIVPVNLDVVVWAAAVLMAALLVVLLCVVAKKGLRERVESDKMD